MKWFISLPLSLFFVVTASAMGVRLTLDHAVRDADAIVHCRIDAVGPISGAAPYNKIATSKVISSVKGLATGTNGLGSWRGGLFDYVCALFIYSATLPADY
jgi:hypothetical protein